VRRVSPPVRVAQIDALDAYGRRLPNGTFNCLGVLECSRSICLAYNTPNLSSINVLPLVDNEMCPETTLQQLLAQLADPEDRWATMFGLSSLGLYSSSLLILLVLSIFRPGVYSSINRWLEFATYASGLSSLIFLVWLPQTDITVFPFNRTAQKITLIVEAIAFVASALSRAPYFQNFTD